MIKNKIKLSSQFIFMIYSYNVPEGSGRFELYLKEKRVATGEYELSPRPNIEEDNKPHYKIVQTYGSQIYVEPKGKQSKQTKLVDIVSYKTGCGSILMDGILKWAKQSKLKTIWLDVLKKNERAIHLYKKYGFIIDTEYERLAKKEWYRMYINLETQGHLKSI